MRLAKITTRLIFTLLLSGEVLCGSIVFIGYQLFSRNYVKLYENMLNAVAEDVTSSIDSSFITYYKDNDADSTYVSVNRFLHGIARQYDLSMLSISCAGEKDYSYHIFIYDVLDEYPGRDFYPRGYRVDIQDGISAENMRKVYEEGEKAAIYALNTKPRAHITYMVPVRDEEGTVVAMVTISKVVQEYVDTMRHYLFITCSAAAKLSFVLIVLIILISRRQIIAPLSIIANETHRFKKEQSINPGWSTRIKARNEITDLACSVEEMEKHIVSSVESFAKVTAEKEKISTEINIARDIQYSMLPASYPTFPETDKVALAAVMIPAKEVGGDLYDYMMLDSDHLMMAVGDVSGKGIPAALFMVITKTLIKTHSSGNLSPADIITRANFHLSLNNDISMFVTCWLGILTISTGELRFVNAAHPYPLLYRDGNVEQLKTKPNFILGGMSFTVYEEHTVFLKPGDRLFLYTDGVTEAMSSSNEQFGSERLKESYLRANVDGGNSRNIIDSIKKDIDLFVQDAPQFDDITMMEFELKEHSDDSILDQLLSSDIQVNP